LDFNSVTNFLFASTTDRSGAEITDGIDRATFLGFFAVRFLFRGFRLLLHVAISVFVVTGEVVGGGFTTQVTVNALVVHKVFTFDVLFVDVSDISHIQV